MWIWLWWITNRCVGVVSPRSMCVNELKLRSIINQYEEYEVSHEGMWSDCILLRFENTFSGIDVILFDDRFIHSYHNVIIIQMKWDGICWGGDYCQTLLLECHSTCCCWVNCVKINQSNELWCECDSSFRLWRLLNVPERRDVIEFESRCLWID